MKREENVPAMVTRLRDLHAADRKERLGDVFLRWIEDPLRPRTNSGRPSLILLLLVALAVLAGGTFLLFSLVQL
jgi:hypothetical protein